MIFSPISWPVSGRPILTVLLFAVWAAYPLHFTLAQSGGNPAGGKDFTEATRDGTQPAFRRMVENHSTWIRSLGDPVVLELVGLDSLRPSQREDPLRLVLQRRILEDFSAPGVNLMASDFTGSNLDGANFSGSNLSHTVFENASLRKAVFSGAVLKKINLAGADLTGASLTRADLRNGNLAGANLHGANLIGADLSGSNLAGADLTEANLNGANLSDTDLSQTLLTGADLHQANLNGAQLFQADLREARLIQADLSGAQLFGADLTDAFMEEANLAGASLSGASLWGTNLFANDLGRTDLKGVDLAGVLFEPSPERLKLLGSQLSKLAHAKNLGLMTYLENSEPLEVLRRLLKSNDYRREVLEITYAIRRGQRRNASINGNVQEKVVSYLQLIFVELTVEYGASPFRPLVILFVLIFFFGAIYLIPLLWPTPRFGEILRITPRDQFFRFSDGVFKEPLSITSFRDLPIALWFSFLSALNIGGRIFNIDDLFINCQTYEYYLRATGWVRTLSGIQALISIYLFLLTLLIFFEKITF